MLVCYSKRGQGSMMKRKEIKETIHSYHWMIQTIALKRSEISDSINQNMAVQYSVEATLPKAPYTTSDPLFVEVVRREEGHASIKKLENKVIAIQRLSKSITDDRQKIILNKILDGRSMRAISRHTNIPLSNVARLRDEIVNIMFLAQVEQTEHLEQSAQC